MGDFEHCPVFDTKPEEEDYQGADPEWLGLKAAEIRADLEAQHSRTKNDFITEAVWEETDGALNPQSETAKGWLEGPFTPEEITERLGTADWAPCHRFGVDQGKKIRTIDDLSRNFTNACASIPDRVNLDGVDEILALAKTWTELINQATKNGGKFWARWQDGTITTHWMHRDFRKKEHQRLNGATLDLAHAYRQLAVEEGQKKYSVVGVPKDGKTHYYLSHALLFGASANVLNFNRAARALNFCVHKCAGAPVTNFFDDFVLVAPAPIAKFMYKGMIAVLEILGWKLKKDSIVFPDIKFTGLGVVFNFEEDARTISVENKKSRMEKIKEQIIELTDRKDRCYYPLHKSPY